MKRLKISLVILLFAAGCARLPNDGIEKELRDEVAIIEDVYRPEGDRPVLPILDEDSGIDDFTEYALLNNPKVESAFYRWKSQVERTAAAKYPPDPEITFGASISGAVQSLMAGIMLMFPAKGKITLEMEAYSVEAQKEMLNFQAEILKTAFNVRDISYRYRLLDEQAQLTEKIIRILQDIESLTLTKLETGQASQSDVLNIQIKKEQLRNMLADIEDYKNVLHQRFKTALGVPAGEEIPRPPSDLSFSEKGFNEEEIWEAVKETNPRLAVMRKEIEQGEILVRLAYRESSPDFKAGLSQSFFSGMAMTTPMLSLTIPRRGRVDAVIAAAEDSLKMRGAEYTAEELEMAVTLSEALFRWRQADREVELYRNNLLPKAEANLELNLSAYVSGVSDIAAFFNSESVFYEFSINYLSAMAFREIALNEISLVIAGIIPEGYPWR